MSSRKQLSRYTVILTLATAIFLPAACNQVQSPPPGASDEPTPPAELQHEVELVAVMGRMQLYMNKLYFAGINDNKELRDFYVHEIEEAIEEIVDGSVTHEGVDISTNMEMYGATQLEVFEKALAENNDFKDAYNNFVNACNSCHKASKYPFIIIKEPTNMVFDNQVYTVD